MSRKMARLVTLERHEVHKINRIRLAEHFHVLPHQIDEMPDEDYYDCLDMLWADEQLRSK